MKVLQTSALATWLRRPENKRWEIEGIRFPTTSAQAIKYEKRGGKSSPKEDIHAGVIALSVAAVPVLTHALPSKQNLVYLFRNRRVLPLRSS